MMAAAPIPWTARAAISAPALVASAQATDPRAKTASPVASSRRRPNRSPSDALVISRAAKLSVYALTVHSRSSIDACRPRWIEVSAVATTSRSSTTMNDPTEASPITQRWAAVIGPGRPGLTAPAVPGTVVPFRSPSEEVTPGRRETGPRPVLATAGVYTCVRPDYEGRAMPGEELLDQARSGDGQAFRQLIEPYRGELQVHCYRILGSVQDTEDLLQETLLAAWRGLPGFEGRSSLRSWLYR